MTAHVDDLAIVGESDCVEKLILDLGKRFKIGAEGDLLHFLSIKITRDHKNPYLYMCQSHYIDDMRKRFLNGTHLLV